MASYSTQRKLISDILCEDFEVEEETVQHYQPTRRNVLLNKNELNELTRCSSAPAGYQVFPAIFFPQNTEEKSPLSGPTGAPATFRTTAPEFIPSSAPPSELEQYRGQIVYMALDQMWSRYLQEHLQQATASDQNLIFTEIYPSVCELSIDIFANYVIQNLFEHGSSTQKRALAQKLAGRVLSLSKNMYGCRVVQKALESAEYSVKLALVCELRSEIDFLAEDQNANHVIQKCVLLLKFVDILWIVERCEVNTLQWAVHPCACMTLQRVIETCPREEILGIINRLTDNVLTVSTDPFGNYVIQYLIEKGLRTDRSVVITQLTGHFSKLSRHKFSSNVIEKCLQFGEPDQVKVIVLDLFNCPEFFELMIDRFANFVVQKCIEVTNGKTRLALIEQVAQFADRLRQHSQGRFILNFIEKAKKGRN